MTARDGGLRMWRAGFDEGEASEEDAQWLGQNCVPRVLFARCNNGRRQTGARRRGACWRGGRYELCTQASGQRMQDAGADGAATAKASFAAGWHDRTSRGGGERFYVVELAAVLRLSRLADSPVQQNRSACTRRGRRSCDQGASRKPWLNRAEREYDEQGCGRAGEGGDRSQRRII